jgi:hypothetical protein
MACKVPHRRAAGTLAREGDEMNGSTRKRLGAAIAMGAAVLLAASAVPVEARDGHGRDRGRHDRVYRHERVYRDHARTERLYRHDGRRWVAPPLLARPHRLPRPHAFTVPWYIRSEHRRAYAPYFAGRVFYAPYGADLDLYYFPVWVGGRCLYEPHYYYGNQLMFSVGDGGPHFFLRMGF